LILKLIAGGDRSREVSYPSFPALSMDLRQKSCSDSALTVLLPQIGAALARELLGLLAPPFGDCLMVA
jgi:hypothetical protein